MPARATDNLTSQPGLGYEGVTGDDRHLRFLRHLSFIDAPQIGLCLQLASALIRSPFHRKIEALGITRSRQLWR